MLKSMKFLGVVFLFLVFFAVSVGDAFAKGESSIVLLSASFVPGKGIVYVFNVSGEKNEFKGTARFGGQEFPLVCNFRDDGALSCTLSQGGAKYLGQTARVTLNGFVFSAIVYPPVEKHYCSNVYDMNPDWPGYDVGDGSETFWMFSGEYCQESPFNYLDQVVYNENLYHYLPDDFIYGWTGESYGDGLFGMPNWW